MTDQTVKDEQTQPDDTLSTTSSLAVAQTRRQILEVLDRYDLRPLRTEFLSDAPEDASSRAMAMAIANLKGSILRLERPDIDDIIERIDMRTVLPSSRPPRSSLL
ncbi:MAG: hypothetical protein U0487_01670 [Patescibacteria group bacterium]